MKNRPVILFSSAGRRVALMNIFRRAARELGAEPRILAADLDPSWSPACQAADKALRVVRCTDLEFIPQMLEICRKESVDLIVPTIDTELLAYAEHREDFRALGTEVHVGDPEFVRIARDKAATCRTLRDHGIATPAGWTLEELLGMERVPFPVLLKPRGGSCSKGIRIATCLEDIREAASENDEAWLAQEICEGAEYTVNCYYDRDGRWVSAVPHYRKFVRDGEVCFAETRRVPAFTDVARRLSKVFSGRIRGCICFQGFLKEDGDVRVFEINARFGGGYPICDRAGGTYARWILQDLLGMIPDHHDNWREGVRMLRYDEAFFTEAGGTSC